jgi:predicted amidohydrolase YtcJ
MQIITKIKLIVGMHAAIYRTIGVQPDSVVVSPAERLSFAEACRMYTFNGAYTAGEEDRLGMLKPGYKADFVVVDRPVWESSAERTAETWQLLRQVKVHQVWVDGVERYAAK